MWLVRESAVFLRDGLPSRIAKVIIYRRIGLRVGFGLRKFLSMKIDITLLDELTAQAQASPRLRMNMDLRNSAADTSQRMLNAIEPGSVVPIHRHQKTSETVVVLRGRVVQYLYDDEGRETGSVLLAPLGAGCHVADGPCNDMEAVPAMQVEMGQWHRIESLESGTVILEMKDGAYEPIGEEDIL